MLQMISSSKTAKLTTPLTTPLYEQYRTTTNKDQHALTVMTPCYPLSSWWCLFYADLHSFKWGWSLWEFPYRHHAHQREVFL
ncbi:hypothetical protein E5H11_19755 [Escherichia coli]|nr:hypothetical protein [Escherichia coli]EFH8694169.1 hypothetical protein [Escherichia coli]